MEDPQEPVREQANKINKASSSPWRFETNWNFQQFELLNLLDGFAKNIDFLWRSNVNRYTMVHLIVLLFSSNFSHGLEETIIPFSAPGFSGLVSSEGTRAPLLQSHETMAIWKWNNPLS